MGLDAYFSVGRTNTWMWPSSKIMKLGKNHILEMSFGLCSGIVTSLVCSFSYCKSVMLSINLYNC